MGNVISALSRDGSAQTVDLIEIISQKNIELLTSLVALFGENECGSVGLLVADVVNHVAVLEPLSIAEAAMAVADSF